MLKQNLAKFSTKPLLPKSTKRIFLPNPDKKPRKPPQPPPPHPRLQEVPSATVQIFGPRINNFNIQMLSTKLHQHIFPHKKQNINPVILEQCRKNLIKYNMAKGEPKLLKDVDFALPPLMGADIEEHFEFIAREQSEPYKNLVQNLKNIPKRPKKWVLKSGWWRYEAGKEPAEVPYPLESALVFDVEVCVAVGKTPTLATAASDKAWYGWVSPYLIDGHCKTVERHQYSTESLIPFEDLEDTRAKIIIGHNVSYDRARIREQYFLKQTGTRFLDTMSLHICVSGMTSFQRAILKSGKTNEEDEPWSNNSALNNLSDVHKLYCGKAINKETRDIFVDGSLDEIRDNFQTAMKYCSGDVIATFNVLNELFPMFLERFPHPATLAGMLELGCAYLPINQNWNRYLEESEQVFDDLNIESKILLARRADQACTMLHDQKYKEDLWMWDQDWEVKERKFRVNKKTKSSTKEEENNECGTATVERKETLEEFDEEEDKLKKKFQYLWATKDVLRSTNTFLAGYPNWYRKLCHKPDNTNWVPGPNLISTSMQITPKLLCLTWEGYPLHYLRDKGWGFLVPFSDDLEVERKIPLKQLLEKCPLLLNKTGGNPNIDIVGAVQENLMRKEYYSRLKKDKTEGLYKGTGIWCGVELEDCCWFFKLPHKNGSAYNVGNPLARDFLNKFSENVLASDKKDAEKVLAMARMLSYWRNNRDRIFDQMVVWLEDYGAILPQVVVCGTLTRRAVEPTWMTASNAHSERIGSELRAMIQAPEGYSIVGADVDSQELWIASLIGDAYCAKVHGATPFGWMTLSGTKADSTDMHSVTAKAVGISRDHAKVLNYARIYGAGQNFAEKLLKQFNPSMAEGEARSKAVKMFTMTKGQKIFQLKHCLDGFPDKPYSKWQAFEMAKKFNKPIDELFNRSQWIGGTESAMFNQLENIANSPNPRTPILNCALSRALEKSGDRYLPTRVNWVVQSGAVDFLHLMLVSMRWLMKDKARFCLSFHDEVRYLVPDQYKYKAALAMHVTNLLVRSFCASKLKMYDLPQSVAFFSSVEVDKVLRKEANNDCKTPSNPHGLEKGYGIKHGESLDIYEAVKKAAGKNPAWYKNCIIISL